MDSNQNNVTKTLKEENMSKTPKQLNPEIGKQMIDHVKETCRSDQPIEDILVYLESVFLDDDSRQYFGFSSMQEFHKTVQKEMREHSQKIKEQKSCKSVPLVVQNVCKNCELCIVHKKCSLCSIAEWGRQMVQDSRTKDEREKLKNYIIYLRQVQEDNENENLTLKSTVKSLEAENSKLNARIAGFELDEKRRNEEEKNLNQDMMSNFRELVETELQCVICSDLIIEANSLNCGHTFCSYCICEWRHQKDSCPVCRSNIKSANPVKILDGFVDKAFDQLDVEGAEKSRKDIKEERAILKKQAENVRRQPYDNRTSFRRPNPSDLIYPGLEMLRAAFHHSVRDALEDDDDIPELEDSFEDLPDLVSDFSPRRSNVIFPAVSPLQLNLIAHDSPRRSNVIFPAVSPLQLNLITHDSGEPGPEVDAVGTDETSTESDNDSRGSFEVLNGSSMDPSGSDEDPSESEVDLSGSDEDSTGLVEDSSGSEEDTNGPEEDLVGLVEDSNREEESPELGDFSSAFENVEDLLIRRLADEILRSELYEDIPRHGVTNDLPRAILMDFISRMEQTELPIEELPRLSDEVSRSELMENSSRGRLLDEGPRFLESYRSELMEHWGIEPVISSSPSYRLEEEIPIIIRRRRQAEDLLRRRLADEILRSELYGDIPRQVVTNDLPRAILMDFVSRIELPTGLPPRPIEELPSNRLSSEVHRSQLMEDLRSQGFISRIGLPTGLPTRPIEELPSNRLSSEVPRSQLMEDFRSQGLSRRELLRSSRQDVFASENRVGQLQNRLQQQQQQQPRRQMRRRRY